jgi:hypothetical protein
MKNVPIKAGWQHSRAEVFWNEIAPCDHVVQIYDNDGFFLDALAGYVGGGINSGDCCIVIATKAHLEALHDRLRRHVVRVDTLISDKRYIPLEADDILSRFIVNGWPDETLFMKTISGLIKKADRKKRRIRAFGEMVAILWAQGNKEATIELERLWNKFCEKEELCLFCAYPKNGFTDNVNISLTHVCGVHSKMITGSESQLTEIHYRNIDKKE